MPDLRPTTCPALDFSGVSSSAVTNIDPGTTGSSFVTVATYYDSIQIQSNIWDSWTGSATTASTTTGPVTGDLCHFIIQGNTSSAINTWTSPAFFHAEHADHQLRPPQFNSPPQRRRSLTEIARDKGRRLRDAARARRFREQARTRAETLLRSMLSDEQVHELEKHNRFHVRVRDPKQLGCERVYRIERGFQGNVKLIEGGRATKRYCIHADSRLPPPDQMLAQKLLLESNESEFLRIANMTNLRGYG